MSLERKDVRFKLSPEDHQDLAVVAQADQLDIGEWVESVVREELRRRIHVANVITQGAARRGKTGSNRE